MKEISRKAASWLLMLVLVLGTIPFMTDTVHATGNNYTVTVNAGAATYYCTGQSNNNWATPSTVEITLKKDSTTVGSGTVNSASGSVTIAATDVPNKMNLTVTATGPTQDGSGNSGSYTAVMTESNISISPNPSASGSCQCEQVLSPYPAMGYTCDVTYTVTQAHSHSWSYSASENTITATCNGSGTCDAGSPKTMTLSASNATYNGSTHGASLSGAWTATNGLTAPGSITYVGVNGTSYGSSTTAPTAAGSYRASVTVGTATATKDFTISKATNPMTFTATQNVAKNYSASSQEASLAAASSGQGNVTYAITSQKKGSEDVSYFTINGTTLTIAENTPVGTYSVAVRATAAGNNNYNDSTKDSTVTVTITGIPVTVTYLTAEDKVYDGTTTATPVLTNATLSGILAGEDVTIESVTGTFSDANAGNDKTVTFNVTLAGEDRGHYTIASNPTATANIARRTITIKAADQEVELNSAVSNSADKAVVASGTLATGHAIDTVAIDNAATTATNALTTGGSVVISAVTIKAGSTDVTSNYDITDYEAGALSVTKLTPQFTTPLTTIPSIVYDNTEQTLVTGGSLTSGTLWYRLGTSGTWTTTPPAAVYAGNYTVYYYIEGNDEYKNVGSEESPAGYVVGVINPFEVTVNWLITDFVYDGTAHIPTAAISNLLPGDESSVTVLGAQTLAGTYTATASAVSNSNYTLSSTLPTSQFSITGAKLVYASGSAITNPKRYETLEAVLAPTNNGDSYKWFRGSTEIEGATSSTYTLTAEDDNQNIKAVITRNGTEYASASVGPVTPVYRVTGIVYENGGTTPFNGVTVAIKKGNNTLVQTSTNANGEFTFSGIEKGNYNLVLEGSVSGTQVKKTQLLNLTSDISDLTVEMPSGKKESVLETSNAGSFAAVVGGLDECAAEFNPGSGEKITVQMTITDENSVGSEGRLTEDDRAAFTTGKAMIASLPAVSGKIVEYMNIKLDQTSSNNPTNHTDIGDTNQKVMTIIMDYDFTGKYGVTVFRYHDSAAETFVQSSSGTDGTYQLDTINGKITIFAKKFSTYAIGYSTTPVSSGGSGRGGGSYGVVTTSAVTVTPSVVMAHWDECTMHEDCPIWPFTDASASEWYHDGVHWALENSVMQGFGDGLFMPNGATTRAQVAQIIYNLEGKPSYSGYSSFNDVPQEEWYATAIAWAENTGVVTGYDSQTFGPNDTITREQFAAMLYRYAQSKGKGFTGDWSFLLDYPDATLTGEWAYEAMCWLNMQGIINGIDRTTETLLEPQGDATRAQVATMFMRYYTELIK